MYACEEMCMYVMTIKFSVGKNDKKKITKDLWIYTKVKLNLYFLKKNISSGRLVRQSSAKTGDLTWVPGYPELHNEALSLQRKQEGQNKQTNKQTFLKMTMRILRLSFQPSQWLPILICHVSVWVIPSSEPLERISVLEH